MSSWLKPLALTALLLLGFYMIDSRAEQRGKDAALLLQTNNKQLVLEAAQAVEDQLKREAIKRDQALYERLKTIRAVDKTTLIKEIRSEARFSDPALGLTDSMFNTLNSARALTGGDTSDAGGKGPLPGAPQVEGQDN